MASMLCYCRGQYAGVSCRGLWQTSIRNGRGASIPPALAPEGYWKSVHWVFSNGSGSVAECISRSSDRGRNQLGTRVLSRRRRRHLCDFTAILHRSPSATRGLHPPISDGCAHQGLRPPHEQRTAATATPFHHTSAIILAAGGSILSMDGLRSPATKWRPRSTPLDWLNFFRVYGVAVGEIERIVRQG
jgi:hypothetical protein